MNPKYAAPHATVDQRQHQGTVSGSAHTEDALQFLGAEDLHPLLLQPGHPHGHGIFDPAFVIGKPEEGPHGSKAPLPAHRAA